VRDSQTQAKLNPQTPSSGASRHLLPVGEGSKASSTASRSPLTQNPSPPGRGAGVRDSQPQAKLNPQTPSSGASRHLFPVGEGSKASSTASRSPVTQTPPRERGRGEGLAASSHAQPSNTLIRRFAPPSPGGRRRRTVTRCSGSDPRCRPACRVWRRRNRCRPSVSNRHDPVRRTRRLPSGVP